MLVEKVARALAIADRRDPDAPAWVQYPGGHPFGLCWRDQYGDKARAAIAAVFDDLASSWQNDGDTYHGFQFADWLAQARKEALE